MFLLDQLIGIDHQIFLFISGPSGIAFLDSIFVFLAEATVFLVPLYLVYRWFGGVKGKTQSLNVFLSSVLSVLAGYGMGMFFSRPSPFQIFETVVSGAAENSFPSTHMSLMLGFLFSLYLVEESDVLKRFFLMVVVVTGFSRVFVGEHYPLDVLGSVVAGLVGSNISKLLFSRFKKYVIVCVGWFQEKEERFF